MRQYAYMGPQWIHKSFARWLMHAQVLKWSDLKLGLQATSHLPSSCLRDPLEVMEACWEPQLRKVSTNSLIGCWLRKQTQIQAKHQRPQ